MSKESTRTEPCPDCGETGHVVQVDVDVIQRIPHVRRVIVEHCATCSGSGKQKKKVEEPTA